MLKVYNSNRMDVLKSLVEHIIESNKLLDNQLNNLLFPETIIVQNNGVIQWLKISFLKKFGTLVKVNFLNPENFIGNIVSEMFPEISPLSILNKQKIIWKLMSVLPNILEHNEFFILRNYLKEDTNQQKLLKLVFHIADLYDQYLIYRPDWISYWESGSLIEELPEKKQIWQAILWKTLIKDSKNLEKITWHQSNLCTHLVSMLENVKTLPKKNFSRIFVFGIHTLPPLYFKVLKSLGKHFDIHILFINPCRYYWGDISDPIYQTQKIFLQNQRCIESKLVVQSAKKNRKNKYQESPNPLLASWGKLGRDYVYMLSEITAFDKDGSQFFTKITKNSLLHNLQNDLLELENHANIKFNNSIKSIYNNGNRKRLLDPNDHSITINNCYSIQNEVEVLYNRLLSIMKEDSELAPHEIAVMITDIDRYRPFIQAVFDNSIRKDQCLFSYVISDLCTRKTYSSLQAFIRLIFLLENCFTFEDALSLLEVPIIGKRFNVDEQELHFFIQWLNKANIHWEVNNNNIQKFRSLINRKNIPYSKLKCTKLEMKTMMLEISTNFSMRKLAESFVSLLNLLNRWHINIIKNRTLNEWAPICQRILDDFFAPDYHSAFILELIKNKWDYIIQNGIDAQYNKVISLAMLREILITHLDKERTEQKLLTVIGSINICNFTTLRSIPFKVICLLGMNNGIYPRTFTSCKFDLKNYQPRRGDRNCYDNEKYLFLEALMSAQQKLYISYVGYSTQNNNNKLSPSILIQELEEYIAQSHYLPGDEKLNCEQNEQKIKEHINWIHTKMFFNTINYHSDNRQKNSSKSKLLTVNKINKRYAGFFHELTPLTFNRLSFEQLYRFWSHPVRAFFQMRLKIHLHSKEKINSNIESFKIEGLDRYQLNQDLLDTLIKQKDIKKLLLYYHRSKILPYGAFGKIIWEEQYQKMQSLAERIIKYRKNSFRIKINLYCHNMHLTGYLQNVQDDGLLRWCSSSNISHGMKLWLEHLVYCAIGGNGKSRFLSYNKKKEWCFLPFPKEKALFFLDQLITGYKLGMVKPLFFLPESSGAWIKTCYDAKNHILLTDNETLKKAYSNFLETYEGNQIFRGESKSFWYQKLCNTLYPENFKAIIKEAKRYLLPLFKFNQL